MARIGVFGGTFDPPHLGHLAVATAALDHNVVDWVLLTPTGRQPLKSAAPLASYADRCAMVELLAQARRGLELCRADAPHPDGSPNYSADLVRALLAGAKRSDDFCLIVGSDSFRTLPAWHQAPYLAKHCEWIVVSRPGEDLKTTIAEIAAQLSIPLEHICALDDVAVPISSTVLRTRLAAGDPCTDALTPEVAAYIREHNLYRLA